MKNPYKAPSFNETSFNCPNCGAFAKQTWGRVEWVDEFNRSFDINGLRFAICSHCGNYSHWKFRNQTNSMIYPFGANAPLPNQDLPEELILDYEEARSILQLSPRGASAILRLTIQKLCKELGEKGKNINDDIANLVKKGLPVIVQQALDAVRVIGNEAVHPGQIDFNDNPVIAHKLFSLVNLIADIMITQPKQVSEIFNSLPESQLKAIEKRDLSK